MPRRKSFTSTLYSLARASNNLRAASHGPAAYGARVVRRKVYGKSMGATGKLLKNVQAEVATKALVADRLRGPQIAREYSGSGDCAGQLRTRCAGSSFIVAPWRARGADRSIASWVAMPSWLVWPRNLRHRRCTTAPSWRGRDRPTLPAHRPMASGVS